VGNPPTEKIPWNIFANVWVKNKEWRKIENIEIVNN